MAMSKNPRKSAPAQRFLELPQPSYLQIQALEKSIADLEQRVFSLENALSAFAVPIGASGAGIFQQRIGASIAPVVASPAVAFLGYTGPVLQAPASQLAQATIWNAVTVILVNRNIIGTLTPISGATITFSITAGAGISLSNTAAGPGVRPGASVSVLTNVAGDATVYFNAPGVATAMLNSSGPGVSRNTILNIV